MRKPGFRRRSRCLAALLASLSIVALAAEEVDQEIMKRFEFFSQMDVIEHLDLVSQLEALLSGKEAK